MDRLTREEALEARLNSLERRIEQLEDWTGADEEPGPAQDEPSVAERLGTQRMIIVQLLQHLEKLVPNFAVERLQRGLHMVDEKANRTAAERFELTPEEIEAAVMRSRKIIDDHLPLETSRTRQS
jgi:hypothetical protein